MFEWAAETLLAMHLPGHGHFLCRINRHVANALMRPLSVVVFDALVNDVPELLLIEEDRYLQALVCDQTNRSAQALRFGASKVACLASRWV